jgi:hypothetical protein
LILICANPNKLPIIKDNIELINNKLFNTGKPTTKPSKFIEAPSQKEIKLVRLSIVVIYPLLLNILLLIPPITPI